MPFSFRFAWCFCEILRLRFGTQVLWGATSNVAGSFFIFSISFFRTVSACFCDDCLRIFSAIFFGHARRRKHGHALCARQRKQEHARQRDHRHARRARQRKHGHVRCAQQRKHEHVRRRKHEHARQRRHGHAYHARRRGTDTRVTRHASRVRRRVSP